MTSARVRYFVMISKISTGSCAIGHVATGGDGDEAATGLDRDGTALWAMRPSKDKADDNECVDQVVMEDAEEEEEEEVEDEAAAGRFLASLAA